MKTIICLALAALLMPGTAYSDALEVGIFPRRSIKSTHSMYKPMMDHLASAIGRPVNMHVSKDFHSFWGSLSAGKFDLVHFNQYHYALAHKKYGYEAILKNVEFNSPNVGAVLLVKRDSGINTLEDLRGKRIMFGGGPKAMMSYIMPHWLLQEAGIQKGEYTEIMAKNPINALIATYKGAADAVGTADIGLKLPLVQNSINVSEMKIIASTPKIPFLAWAVSKELDSNLAQRIQAVLSALDSTTEGGTILNMARINKIEIADDADYDSARVFIKAVYGDDLERN